MQIEFRMPSLGPDMEAGTLVEWRVKPGDAVKRGDIVALIETDKGVIDVEIFAEGTVEKLLIEQGAHVPVGSVLALLNAQTSGVMTPAPAFRAVETPVTPQPQPERPAKEPAPSPSVEPARHRAKISPAARARAHALGIDPASIAGSGPGGVVTLEDIETCAKSRPSTAVAPAARKPDMRQVIAKAMSRSKREIPHYYLMLTCSFQAARAWLDRHNASVGIEERVLPTALLIRAVALAARAIPDFNGYHEADFVPASQVNVGVAIAMRGGRLVAPAILQADTKPIPAIMHDLRDLTARVRAGHMLGSELTQATITVTSLADDGPDAIVPIIHPPQVAMVGFGSIAERPWVIDGTVKPELTVGITLAADHRVTDGRAGTRFLAHLRDGLQNPERL